MPQITWPADDGAKAQNNPRSPPNPWTGTAGPGPRPIALPPPGVSARTTFLGRIGIPYTPHLHEKERRPAHDEGQHDYEGHLDRADLGLRDELDVADAGQSRAPPAVCCRALSPSGSLGRRRRSRGWVRDFLWRGARRLGGCLSPTESTSTACLPLTLRVKPESPAR